VGCGGCGGGGVGGGGDSPPVRLSLIDATRLGSGRALPDRPIGCVLSAGTQAGGRAVAHSSVARGRVAGGGRLHLQPRPLALWLLHFAARVGARSSSHARQDCGEQAGVSRPVNRPPKGTPRGAAACGERLGVHAARPAGVRARVLFLPRGSQTQMRKGKRSAFFFPRVRG